MSPNKLNQLLEELNQHPNVASFHVLNAEQDFQSSSDKTMVQKQLNHRQKVVFECSASVGPDIEMFLENWIRRVRQWETITGRHLSNAIVHSTGRSMSDKIKLRIMVYLQALVTAIDSRQGFVVYKGSTIALTPLEHKNYEERLPLLIRRLDKLAMEDPKSSHSTWEADDVFAQTFYYGAALCLFFDKSYSRDFAKHRVRQVTKEISQLLASLEGPELPPASSNPVEPS